MIKFGVIGYGNIAKKFTKSIVFILLSVIMKSTGGKKPCQKTNTKKYFQKI